MEENIFHCEFCGRIISHKGKCLHCNIKLKNHTPLTPKVEIPEDNGIEEFRKDLLVEDYHGDRMLLRRKQFGNENFKKYVFDKYGKKCYFCNRDDIRLEVHHLSYVFKCQYSKTKNPGKKSIQRGIADCDKCLKSTPEIFNECMESVTILCWLCHKKLHRLMLKTYGEWIPDKNSIDFDSLKEENINKKKEKLKKYNYMEIVKQTHPNAYSSWTSEEEEKLLKLFETGVSIDNISKILERKTGGITSRLKKLGKIE